MYVLISIKAFLPFPEAVYAIANKTIAWRLSMEGSSMSMALLAREA